MMIFVSILNNKIELLICNCLYYHKKFLLSFYYLLYYLKKIMIDIHDYMYKLDE